jgi:probable rRNA maturation factor
MQVKVQVDKEFVDQVEGGVLERAAIATARHQGVSGPVAVTLVVTGDGTVRRLNRTYRGVDATTDVLAFGDEGQDDLALPADMPRYLGDVILSFPRAAAQARVAQHPVHAELALLTVHGVLHLLGHDHVVPDEKAAMWMAQAEILDQLGVSIAKLPED